MKPVRIGGTGLALLLLAWVSGQSLAAAQDLDCAALKAQIDADSSGEAQAGQIASAIRQRRFEIDRMQTYADSLGCNSGSIFGGDPPQCGDIAARTERLEQAIADLREKLRSGGDQDERRRALADRYNSFCGVGAPDAQVNEPASDAPPMPGDPDGFPPADAPPSDEPAAPRKTVRALCVRHCDGGYFPITDQANADSLDHLGQLCKALCPNTEASLYTTSPSGGIETAVAADGAAYTALPAAFKFQKSYDATCTCKPPHQSWVDALAEAEKLIQNDKGDVTVTQRMSDAMSRPTLPPAAATPVRAPKKIKTARKPKPPPAYGSVPGLADQGGVPAPENPGEDITRQFRQAAPTL